MSENGRRRGTRNSTLFGLLIMMMFVVAASRTEKIADQFAAGQFPLELFYIIMLFILLFQALFYERDTGELVIDTQQWSVEQLPPQLVAGLAIGLGITAPLMAFAGTRQVPEDFGAEFVTQVLYVVFVETVFLVVAVRTIRFRGVQVGLYLQPGLFGFLHAQVRQPWIAGQFTPESIAFFAYAGLFGVLFESIYLARYADLRGRWFGYEKREYFGVVTLMVVHLVVNTVLMVARVQAGEFVLFPLGW